MNVELFAAEAALTQFCKKCREPRICSFLLSAAATNQVGLAAGRTFACDFFDEFFSIVDQVGITPSLGSQVRPGISARVFLAIANERTATPANRANQVVDFLVHGVRQGNDRHQDEPE